MKIALASDHAGFDYKERIKLFLIETGHHVHDFGTDSAVACDYPVFIYPAAKAVSTGECDRGIVLGGSGNGEAIVANRVADVRCALCWNVETARLARQHNNANMISIGQRMIDFNEALAIVQTWLETPFEGGRHLRRIRLIDAMKSQASASPDQPAIELPHRSQLVDEASYTCDSCREDFRFPVDISDGPVQYVVEKCPTCWHENSLKISIEPSGDIEVRANLQPTE